MLTRCTAANPVRLRPDRRLMLYVRYNICPRRFERRKDMGWQRGAEAIGV